MEDVLQATFLKAYIELNRQQTIYNLLEHGRFLIGWLMQRRRNSIADALELRLSCTKPSLSPTLLQYMYIST